VNPSPKAKIPLFLTWTIFCVYEPYWNQCQFSAIVLLHFSQFCYFHHSDLNLRSCGSFITFLLGFSLLSRSLTVRCCSWCCFWVFDRWMRCWIRFVLECCLLKASVKCCPCPWLTWFLAIWEFPSHYPHTASPYSLLLLFCLCIWDCLNLFWKTIFGFNFLCCCDRSRMTFRSFFHEELQFTLFSRWHCILWLYWHFSS